MSQGWKDWSELMNLEFYQIIYKDEQIKELYSFAIPYLNETLSPLFENAVIADLVPQCKSDFISVCSWALRRKRNGGASEVILKNKYGDTELTEERIMAHEFDIAKLTPVHHIDVIGKLMQWHPNAKPCLEELKKFIKIPEVIPHAIYENHFIAKREIYTAYVETCLKPCIEFIGEKEVFKAASGYRQKKERMSGQTEVKDTLAKLGLEDWPMTPFILERLFSIWITGKGFNVVSL